MVPSSIVVTALVAASIVSYAALVALSIAVVVGGRARGAGRRAVERAPRVTILKPLAGDDDELAANLASFARLDYPAFELVLGVASIDDAAYPVARRFLADHPGFPARLVLTDPDAAHNPKVAQLLALVRHATGDVVVVSDSNVRVAPDYLWPLVAELSVPGVGLVTSLFAGTGERSLGAALENLQLGAVVAPAVVLSTRVLARPMTVGKSMAVWRRDLARVGGFARVGDVLAEDHALGDVFLAEGLAIRTSLVPVENRNVACSLRRTVERHTRWAKMRRALAPRSFFVEPLLSPANVAALAAVACPSRSSLVVVAAALAVQTLAGFALVRIVRGHALPWRYAPLELLRALLTLACWARACVSRRVTWRGHDFLLEAGSRVVPVAPTTATATRGVVTQSSR